MEAEPFLVPPSAEGRSVSICRGRLITIEEHVNGTQSRTEGCI